VYQAPIADFRFLLDHVLQAGRLTQLPRYADYSPDLAEAVLTEAGRFASEILLPINRSGDQAGAVLGPQGVATPPGFREAYRQFAEGGWPGLAVNQALGGQGAPQALNTAVEEIWCATNMAFMLGPLLSHGAIEALETAGSPALRAAFLPKMVSGEWMGTMNLTEPQAGSDLAAIRTRAVPEGDHYLLTGQKIFITYGDHDLSDNIVHLVLARIEGAPAGVKGISLFVVPKFIPDGNGKPGDANDLRCVSIEHKLGIHASPTCVMSFGDKGGAHGWLVGEPHQGLPYMFVMMNAARLSVGVQGIGLAERAFQQAREWARTRVQGKPMLAAGAEGGAGAIIHHPDVRRMLLQMRSGVEAMRALALYAALQLDLARALPDEPGRAAALARGELLIPVVKGWGTEFGFELTSVGVQVHGGMGYIEETGIAQQLRDSRITAIYEGTTAIQANDLLGRKLGRDKGAAFASLLADAGRDLAAAAGSADPSVAAAAKLAGEALAELGRTATALMAQVATQPAAAFAGAVPFLRQCGVVLGGWLMARSAHVAATRLAQGAPDAPFMRAKIQTARAYMQHVLPQAYGLARTVVEGGASVAESDAALI
jgi:acyl-CoA dehydrogenase